MTKYMTVIMRLYWVVCAAGAGWVRLEVASENFKFATTLAYRDECFCNFDELRRVSKR